MGSFRPAHRAFTLIEMLVCLAILTVIAGVVFSSQAAFGNSIIISNTAYDVALSLRDAESYGIGSRGFGSVVNTGYGLDFSSAAPTTYLFFADTNPNACSGVSPTCKAGDGVYTPKTSGVGDDLIDTYHLGEGITVTYFCGASAGGNKCSNSFGGTSALDIVFTRPNATPTINGSFGGTSYALSSACVALESPQGALRYVSVSQNGLISATASSCP